MVSGVSFITNYFFAALICHTRTGKNITVFSGGYVTLECIIKINSLVQWWYMKSVEDRYYEKSKKITNYLYVANSVTSNFKGKVSDKLVNRAVGSYSLVLRNVSTEDSGTYFCAADEDRTFWQVTVVNVIGKFYFAFLDLWWMD
jgi:Immunoglobulin V-set domain